jgi:hypothetical protein
VADKSHPHPRRIAPSSRAFQSMMASPLSRLSLDARNRQIWCFAQCIQLSLSLSFSPASR